MLISFAFCLTQVCPTHGPTSWRCWLATCTTCISAASCGSLPWPSQYASRCWRRPYPATRWGFFMTDYTWRDYSRLFVATHSIRLPKFAVIVTVCLPDLFTLTTDSSRAAWANQTAAQAQVSVVQSRRWLQHRVDIRKIVSIKGIFRHIKSKNGWYI